MDRRGGCLLGAEKPAQGQESPGFLQLGSTKEEGKVRWAGAQGWAPAPFTSCFSGPGLVPVQSVAGGMLHIPCTPATHPDRCLRLAPFVVSLSRQPRPWAVPTHWAEREAEPPALPLGETLPRALRGLAQALAGWDPGFVGGSSLCPLCYQSIRVAHGPSRGAMPMPCRGDHRSRDAGQAGTGHN